MSCPICGGAICGFRRRSGAAAAAADAAAAGFMALLLERTLSVGTSSRWITEAEPTAFGEEHELEWTNETLSGEQWAESNSSAYDSHGNTEARAKYQHHQTDKNDQEGGQHEESGGQKAGGSNGGDTGGEQERGDAGGQRSDNDEEDNDNDKEDNDNDKEDNDNDKEDKDNDKEDKDNDEEDKDNDEEDKDNDEEDRVSTDESSISKPGESSSDDISDSTSQSSTSAHGESSSDFSSDPSWQQNIKKDDIPIGLFNSNSINKKQSRISELKNKFNLEVLMLTETRVTPENGDQRLGEISPGEFQVFHQPRVNQEGKSKKHTGGGVAILSSNDLQGVQSEDTSFESFEYVAVDLRHDNWNRPIRTITVYRPPGGKDEGMCKFLEEFKKLLDKFSKDDSILITGDFNIWVNDKNNKHAELFKKLLEDNGLHQKVEEPTHNKGNTLDLVITRNVDINNLHVKKPKEKTKTVINKEGKKKKINITISDHYAVIFIVPPKKPTDPKSKQPKDREE